MSNPVPLNAKRSHVRPASLEQQEAVLNRILRSLRAHKGKGIDGVWFRAEVDDELALQGCLNTVIRQAGGR